MANLVFDFLHHYQRGERRESDPANAYQYDEGHVIEAVLPETVTSVELHYWTRGMEEAEAYTPSSITANNDGSCTVLGNIPNKFFETDGDLRVYIVVNDAEASITTYEGKIHVVHRAMPDDYVDEDPDNPATRILAEAQAAAATATQQAQAASDSAGQAQQSAQTLSQSVEQIATNTQDITALKEELNQDEEYLISDSPVSIPVTDIDDIVSVPDKYIGSGSVGINFFTSSDGYNAYYLITDKEMKVYVEQSNDLGVHMLGVGTGYTGIEPHSSYFTLLCSSKTVYRNLDNNIPYTPETAVTIPAGGVLAVSWNGTGTMKLFGIETEKTIGTPLATDVQKMIDESIEGYRKLQIRYVSGVTGPDSSTEYVEVFQPCKTGYIRYRLVHTEYESVNADVWRISDAYHVSNSHVEITAFTTPGEWECALHLPDRDDFSGGYAHGDEVLIDDAEFFVNGLPVNITGFTNYTEVDSFSMVEKTNLYDPNDHTTIFAEHGSEHYFDSDGLKIYQTVFWLINTSLTNCYLAMLPIAKAVTDHYYTDKTYLPSAIGSTSHSEASAYRAMIYGEDSDVSCRFEVPRYPEVAYFYMTDNGGGTYNKCYFAVDITGGVSRSDFWKSETVYKFSVGD